MAISRLAPLKVADLMTAPFIVSSAMTTREAVALLARAGIPAAPVVDADGDYVGIFEEIGVHRRLSRAVRGFHSPEEFRTGVPFLGERLPDGVWRAFGRIGWAPASELAREIPSVRPDEPVPNALELMRRHGVSVVAVVSEGVVIGIIQADVLTFRLAEVVPAIGE